MTNEFVLDSSKVRTLYGRLWGEIVVYEEVAGKCETQITGSKTIKHDKWISDKDVRLAVEEFNTFLDKIAVPDEITINQKKIRITDPEMSGFCHAVKGITKEFKKVFKFAEKDVRVE